MVEEKMRILLYIDLWGGILNRRRRRGIKSSSLLLYRFLARNVISPLSVDIFAMPSSFGFDFPLDPGTPRLNASNL